MKSNIIVIGGGCHHNALGVIRALGRNGYGVEFISIGSLQRCYVASSRYVTIHHALKDIKELSAFLLYRHPKNNEKEIIISCADSVTEHLSIFQDVLSEYYLLPGNPVKGKMVEVMDKTKMILMAEKHNIISPKIWTLPKDYEKITFPCITKACISSHGGKNDIVICKSREDLDNFLRDNEDSVFVQSYVRKKEEVQFIGCSLYGGEKVIIPGMTKVLRSQPNTNTGFLEYGPVDPFYNNIVENAKEYIRDCQYSGLFSIEFLRDYDDNIWFLETNFRNDGNAFCVTEAGVNLPLIWVKANQGEDYSQEIHMPNKVIVMPEFQDIKLMLTRKIKFTRWLKDWKNTNYFMEYSKDDRRPFFQYIVDKLF